MAYTSYAQIGRKHGTEARLQISRSVDFYAGLFQESAKMDWHKVRELAMTFEPVIKKKWPAYLEEMTGERSTDFRHPGLLLT